MPGPSWDGIVQLNTLRRRSTLPIAQKITLKKANVFNGKTFDGPQDISIEDGLIVQNTDGGEELDCTGKYLIPGLIDCHCHPIVIEDLENLTRNGVTTAMSMAGFTKEHMASIQGHAGLTDVLVAGLPAAGPDNAHAKHMPGWPKDELLTETSQADAFVLRQVEKGADYIKVIVDTPGMSQEVTNAVIDSARRHDKLAVCHAVDCEPVRMALNAGADHIHHCPMDGLLSKKDIDQFQSLHSVLCPTLTMMQTAEKNKPRPGVTFSTALDNVKALHQAGVPIICGTDANQAPGAPANVAFGSSVHHELELLVEAGLSNAEALQAATVWAANHFRLRDRGVITPGYRADLVLLQADPSIDITAVQRIENIWTGGRLFELEKKAN